MKEPGQVGSDVMGSVLLMPSFPSAGPEWGWEWTNKVQVAWDSCPLLRIWGLTLCTAGLPQRLSGKESATMQEMWV